MNDNNQKNSKSSKVPKIISLCLVAIFLIASVIITIYLWPFFKELKDPVKQEEFKNWIQGLGFKGFLIFLGLQVLQIVVAFIPGEITEILAGAMYGPIFGTLFCILGIIIATLIIYGLVALIGKPIVEVFVSKRNEKKWKFLHDSERVEAIFMFVFLLPTTPKDVLIYFAATCKVNLLRIIIISSIVRIPSIMFSTFLGAFLIEGNGKISLIVLLINLGVTIIGLIFTKPIIRFLQNHFTKTKKEVIE